MTDEEGDVNTTQDRFGFHLHKVPARLPVVHISALNLKLNEEKQISLAVHDSHLESL